MATNPTAIPRTLASLVTDLATTRQRFAVLQAVVKERGIGPTDEQDRLWTDLETRDFTLRRDIAAVLWANEGVSADMLCAVLS